MKTADDNKGVESEETTTATTATTETETPGKAVGSKVSEGRAAAGKEIARLDKNIAEKKAAQAAARAANTAKRPAATTAAETTGTGGGAGAAPATPPAAARKAATPKTSKAAESAKEPEGQTASVDPDFAALKTVDELVEAYNEMGATAEDLGLKRITVKSFVDVKTGKLACERLHALIVKTRNNGGASASKEGSNVKTPKGKTASRAKARTPVKGKTSKAAKAAKAPSKRAGLDPAKKFVWPTGKENPCRAGSPRHDRVEVIRKGSGRTVESLLKSGVREGSLKFCLANYGCKLA